MGRTAVCSIMVLALTACAAPGCRDGGEEKKETEIPARPGVAAATVLSAINLGETDEDGPVARDGAGRSRVLRPGDEVRVRERIRVGEHGGMMMALGADRVAVDAGSAVRLDSRSEMELERGRVWVQGALSGEARALTVSQGRHRVRLAGAHGCVAAEGADVSVALVSGSAEVTSGEGPPVHVKAGQRIAVEGEGGVAIRPIGDAGDLVGWTEGLRAEIARRAREADDGLAPAGGGIGTMAARAPGSNSLLPFDVVSQDVTVRVQDRVAVTRVEQVFRNPTKRTVEGLYRFPVPPGARLNRYDMEIGGKLMQGEIVERKRGRAIMKKVIDDFLYMMRDPALVEWESGSTFKTRIFPIAPRAKKRIVMSYIQVLSGEAGRYRWVLPLSAGGAEPPLIPEFRLDARVAGRGGTPIVHTPLYEASTDESGPASTVEFRAQDFRPPVDFVMEIEHEQRPRARLATYGRGDEPDEPLAAVPPAGKDGGGDGWDWFMLDLAPEIDIEGPDLASTADWILVVDTSQSRTAVDMRIQQNLVAALVGALSPEDRVKLIAYDVTARSLSDEWAAPSPELLERVEAFLDVRPAGATNLEAALRQAALEAADGRRCRVVLIGDGAATIGERRAAELADRSARVLSEAGAPVTAIGVGSSVDDLVLGEISRRTGGRLFSISSGEDLLRAAVGIITSTRVPLLEDVRLEIEGVEVRDVSPAHLPNLAVGEEVGVLGRYRGTGEMKVVLRGSLAGRPIERSYAFDVGEGAGANSFVPLVWASRRIDDLTLRGDEDARDEAVRLSSEYSLPCRWTSFIVLENEKMYREFGVERTDDRIGWEGGEIEYAQTGTVDALEMPGSAAAGKGGGGAVLGGAPKAAPAPAKAKKSMSSISPFADGSDALGLESLYKPPIHRRHPPCRVVTDVKTIALPPDVDPDKVDRQVIELAEEVDEAPLNRLHRKRLVDYLMRHGRIDEAAEQVSEWAEFDTADPTVLEYAGEIARLSGDLTEALRLVSGVLDVNPEKERVLESLALWMETRERWDVAYALRTAIHLVNPGNEGDVLAMAVAASRAGLDEEARRAASLLVDRTEDGKLRLAKGVRLKAASKEAITRLAAGEELPLGYGSPSLGDAASARFSVKLTWEGGADLDLWVASSSGAYLGGDEHDGAVIGGSQGTAGEVFFMPKGAKGRYTIQVHCASTDCGSVQGQVVIRALGEKRTLPFVLEQGQGTSVGEVRISRKRSNC